MFVYAKLSMFMFECMLLSVEPALNLIKLKFTTLSLGDRLETAKNCWSIYIYIYISTKGFSPLTFKGSTIDGLMPCLFQFFTM